MNLESDADDRRSPDVHLNLNVRGLPLSATLRINELSNKMLREGHRVFKMGLGQSPFPVPMCVQEELRANAYQKDYLPVAGLREDFTRRTHLQNPALADDDHLVTSVAEDLAEAIRQAAG